MLSRLRKNCYDIFHDFKMFRVLRKSKYNLVLIKDKFISALIAIVASKLFKLKFIYWLSYPFPEDFLYQVNVGIARYPFLYWLRGHFLKFMLYRIILPFSDHVFVQTEQMQKHIVEHGITKEKMTPVPMGVSTKEIPFFGYQSNHNRADKEKAVVYLGTLFRGRKLDFLIRVFEKVLRKERNAKLYLVGGGIDPLDDQIVRDEVGRFGIDDAVTITGLLHQQEAWEYAKHATVCVSPIYPAPILDCGSPTKLIEYMAMGKAVVANDHPEQGLVISESKAGICVPYDEYEFAEAILRLFNSPEEARQMGLRGREYVEKHRSYEEIADSVETKLLEVCKIP